MNSKEVAVLTGVSVRALHHYDEIGLLCPARNPGNGYRDYAQADLDQLQQILFFKACGFPLKSIQALLQNPAFDRARAFALQKKYLLHEKEKINRMLTTLEKSMQALKGEIEMSQQEKFSGFDFSANPYEEEARQLWGDEAVDRSNRQLEELTDGEKEKLAGSMEEMLQRLARLIGDPASEAAQQGMAEYFRFLNGNFGYQYTPDAFAGLGQLYVADERFQKNIDRYGEGLSSFLAQAMGIFAEEQK